MAPIVVYLLGFAVLIVGVAYGASLAGVPTSWIGVGVLVMLGLGIISAGTRMRGNRGPP